MSAQKYQLVSLFFLLLFTKMSEWVHFVPEKLVWATVRFWATATLAEKLQVSMSSCRPSNFVFSHSLALATKALPTTYLPPPSPYLHIRSFCCFFCVCNFIPLSKLNYRLLYIYLASGYFHKRKIYPYTVSKQSFLFLFFDEKKGLWLVLIVACCR